MWPNSITDKIYGFTKRFDETLFDEMIIEYVNKVLYRLDMKKIINI